MVQQVDYGRQVWRAKGCGSHDHAESGGLGSESNMKSNMGAAGVLGGAVMIGRGLGEQRGLAGAAQM